MLTDEQAKTAISQNLTRILDEKGRSVYWLMKALDVSSGTIYPIVRGEQQPSLGFASRIADVLEIDVSDLLQEVQKKNRK